jgi:hypothetical protein
MGDRVYEIKAGARGHERPGSLQIDRRECNNAEQRRVIPQSRGTAILAVRMGKMPMPRSLARPRLRDYKGGIQSVDTFL